MQDDIPQRAFGQFHLLEVKLLVPGVLVGAQFAAHWFLMGSTGNLEPLEEATAVNVLHCAGALAR